jgi:hypothetical protein
LTGQMFSESKSEVWDRCKDIEGGGYGRE